MNQKQLRLEEVIFDQKELEKVDTLEREGARALRQQIPTPYMGNIGKVGEVIAQNNPAQFTYEDDLEEYGYRLAWIRASLESAFLLHLGRRLSEHGTMTSYTNWRESRSLSSIHFPGWSEYDQESVDILLQFFVSPLMSAYRNDLGSITDLDYEGLLDMTQDILYHYLPAREPEKTAQLGILMRKLKTIDDPFQSLSDENDRLFPSAQRKGSGIDALLSLQQSEPSLLPFIAANCVGSFDTPSRQKTPEKNLFAAFALLLYYKKENRYTYSTTNSMSFEAILRKIFPESKTQPWTMLALQLGHFKSEDGETFPIPEPKHWYKKQNSKQLSRQQLEKVKNQMDSKARNVRSVLREWKRRRFEEILAGKELTW